MKAFDGALRDTVWSTETIVSLAGDLSPGFQENA